MKMLVLPSTIGSAKTIGDFGISCVTIGIEIAIKPTAMRSDFRVNFGICKSRITSVLSERRNQFADERRSEVKY